MDTDTVRRNDPRSVIEQRIYKGDYPLRDPRHLLPQCYRFWVRVYRGYPSPILGSEVCSPICVHPCPSVVNNPPIRGTHGWTRMNTDTNRRVPDRPSRGSGRRPCLPSDVVSFPHQPPACHARRAGLAMTTHVYLSARYTCRSGFTPRS